MLIIAGNTDLVDLICHDDATASSVVLTLSLSNDSMKDSIDASIKDSSDASIRQDQSIDPANLIVVDAVGAIACRGICDMCPTLWPSVVDTPGNEHEGGRCVAHQLVHRLELGEKAVRIIIIIVIGRRVESIGHFEAAHPRLAQHRSA